MCRGSWECSCDGPEDHCIACDDKDKQIESIHHYFEGVMEHITNGDMDLLDHCLGEICSNLNIQWPKDQFGNYKQINLGKVS